MSAFKITNIRKLKTITQLGIAIIVLIISVLLVLSYFGQNVGSFTISLHSDMFTRGLSLSETIDFNKPSSRLAADVLHDAYPIGQVGRPEEFPNIINLEEIVSYEGAKNGRDYMAYSFYIQNAGEEMVNYSYSVEIESTLKGVDEAIRIAIIKAENISENKINLDEMKVYAKKQSSLGSTPGEPEPGSIPFYSHDKVNYDERFDFEIGEIDRFIIILWLHGEDPDCNDTIIDGSIKLSMKFNIID